METNQNVEQPRQNIVVVGNQKSAGVAAILALLFGPFGLFYASALGGIVMLIISVVVAFISFGIGLIFTNIICVIWAIIAVNNSNKKITSNYS